MAGRNLVKLEKLRSSLGLGEEVPIIVADAMDADAMDKLIGQTNALVNYAGTPFIDKVTNPWQRRLILATTLTIHIHYSRRD